MHGTTGRPLVPGQSGAPGPGRRAIALTRRIDATPAELWPLLSTPSGLERWVGTYEGDPASGVVTFRMTAEGPEAQAAPMHILACRPESVVEVAFPVGDDRWEVEILLDGDGDGDGDGDIATGSTELRFIHRSDDAPGLGTIGAGWEFYLDRLEAAARGADVEVFDFADYEGIATEYARRLSA